jgi:phage gp16-like protein
MSLHPKKLALLHVAKKQLAMTDDDWRAMLSRAAGYDSSADLDDIGFERVMLELRRLGFKSTSAKRSYGHRPGFATPAQIATMRTIWKEWHGDDPDERALNAWLTRFHHVSALRFVTREKANAVLVALKAMLARKLRSAS